MSVRSDVFTRRALNFPAISPCESISLSTLLSSLIRLGSSICQYKSSTFFVNQRNAKNSIRLIENILLVLDQIIPSPENGSSNIAKSIACSLSELHFIFQKVQFLLEDITRKDYSRLWMLAKSEFVSGQFRLLMKAMWVALDVLPLEKMDICEEVKELAEFVKIQAMKMDFGIEVADQRTMSKIYSILDQFEGGVINPEPNDLNNILDYLSIRTWSDCNKEVKFLESEVGLELQTYGMRDFPLLCSLVAFLIFCRCTLFESVDRQDEEKRKQRQKQSDDVFYKFLKSDDDFRCPITLEIMCDPVTISTGHTYDRISILKWFNAGNPTCPKTGKKVKSTELVPNLSMKHLIQQYCSENSIPFAAGSVRRSRDSTNPGSLAAEMAMNLLAKFLVGKLVNGRSSEQNKAAYEIRLITKTSIFNRSCLVKSGAIPPLLNLLFSSYSFIQENAIAALLNLSKFSTSKRVIVENGGLITIIHVLKDGLKMEARQHAAGALFYLASVEDYRIMIGEIPDAIPALLELIRDGADRGKKNALVTLLGLLVYHGNHGRVLEAGLVPLLADQFRFLHREELITDALAVLANLADKPDGTAAILSTGGSFLPMILEILGSSNSGMVKEHCASLLLSLCIHGRSDSEVVPILVKNTSLMGILYSQLTDGTSRASKKAGSLIKILHSFNEKSSHGFSTPPPHERFIHVR